jgi:mRNA-degrading endonuclease RelE of RelBE toxin-antitoxin system
MPELIPNKKFISDLEKFKKDKTQLKKIAKCLKFLEENPLHPGLRIERIANDPTAWSVRVDKRYRISFEPTAFQNTGAPDWKLSLKLLRILDHDDLYKSPHLKD